MTTALKGGLVLAFIRGPRVEFKFRDMDIGCDTSLTASKATPSNGHRRVAFNHFLENNCCPCIFFSVAPSAKPLHGQRTLGHRTTTSCHRISYKTMVTNLSCSVASVDRAPCPSQWIERHLVSGGLSFSELPPDLESDPATHVG